VRSSSASTSGKTIAALRDSGALTDREFEAEKRRILDDRQRMGLA